MTRSKRTNRQSTRRLVESALMVAISTALSLFTVAQLPYGGSITVASALPIILVAYRHGIGWGLGAGAAYAVLQQLLGLSNLSYFSTWQSVLAIIVLDYLAAFTVTGLGGIFRGIIRRQSTALCCGALLISLLRYVCHVVSGATVWAGFSIPTEAALLYSLGYNATYMIPETLVLVLAAWYLGSVMDFGREQPTRMVGTAENRTAGGFIAAVMAVGVAVAAVDVVLLFPRLQNADSGKFDFSGLWAEPFLESCWLPISVITAVGLITAAILCVIAKRRGEQSIASEKTPSNEA